MSMDFAGASAQVISNEFVAKKAPVAWAHIMALAAEDGYTDEPKALNTLWRLVENEIYGQDDLEYEPAEGSPLALDIQEVGDTTRREAYQAAMATLVEEFAEATKVGDSRLRLYISSHNSDDEGSVYDEVDGAYFGLAFDTVYTMTPAAKALGEELKWANYVQVC